MSLLNSLVVTSLPFIPKSIVGQISKRYIAGVSLGDAVRTVKELNRRGFVSTLDLLGEDIHEREKTTAMRSNCVEMFREIDRSALNANVSVKLSQLGLRIDKSLCYQNVRAVVEEAKKLKNFVRIDMEDSTTTSDTLEVYRKLRDEGFENVGVVLQAYMKRSDADVRQLVKLKANFRLCKGIYIESPDIAHKDREDIRRNYILLLRTMVENGCYVGIATHDEYLIEKSYDIIQQNGLKSSQYEFQMLLGVREPLRDSIIKAGHRLRVYVPYGEQWYAYSIRRLKENPQIAGYVIRETLGR